MEFDVIFVQNRVLSILLMSVVRVRIIVYGSAILIPITMAPIPPIHISKWCHLKFLHLNDNLR